MITPPAPAWGRFRSLEDVERFRLIFRSFGPDKTGKNHFLYTGPSPIALQAFDPGGTEGVAEKFIRNGKEIRMSFYRFDKRNLHTIQKKDAVDIRDQFIEDYELALTRARSIQWDETEVWELFRFAEHGKASAAPKDYVKLNALYRDLIQQAYDKGVNLQLIQKVKERWISVESTDREGRPIMKPQNTGEFEATGFRDAGYIVQANFEHTWDAEHGFGIHVLNCRQNMGVAGQTFYNTSFPELAQQIFTNSDEEDWV